MRKKERIVAGCVLLGILFGAAVLLIALLGGGAKWLLDGLRATDVILQKPRAFGGFHLAWLLLCILLSAGLGVFGARNGRDMTDRVVFGAGLLLLVFELYKQAYSFFVLHQGTYDFGIFPFQFCSLPLYLYLLLPFLREGRVKDILYRFLALYGTMGGCLVMGYPASTDRLSLCVHTMLWHTVMIATGMLILFSRGYGKSWRREVLGTAPVFLGFLGLATLLNIVLTPFAVNSPNPLNLFYMSPYEETYFMVVGDVQRAFGWLPSLLTYALLFVFVGATLVFWAAFLIRQFVSCVAKRKKRLEKDEKK